MAHETASPADGPRELLASVRDLTRRVRSVQRSTWFPLLVFAVITLAAVPLYRYGPRHPGACRSEGTARDCSVVTPWARVYWPIALMLAYAAIAAFYVVRSRRRGVGTPIRPYVVVGVVVAVLATAGSLWSAQHPPAPSAVGSPLTQVTEHLTTPAAAIGLALLVLAWVERNRALTWYGLVYLVIVLMPGSWLPVDLDRAVGLSAWLFVPRLLVTAGLLLAGSLGFALMARLASGARDE